MAKAKQIKKAFPAWGTCEEAEKAGYASYSHCPHLCVDIPEGCATVSCKLPDGRRVTFTFIEATTDMKKAGISHHCCDFMSHDSGRVRDDLPVQEMHTGNYPDAPEEVIQLSALTAGRVNSITTGEP